MSDGQAHAEPEKKKRPAFQFYPGDWRKDVQLRSCSVAARGLWIDLMCVMHDCEPYGHLSLNGSPMTPAKLQGQIGVPAGTISKLLAELLENGVARQLADGTIYSKRMVEDECVRNARAEGGKAGSEHGIKGAEHGSKGGRPRKETGDKKPPLEPPKEPPPSSSSSSSSSASAEEETALAVSARAKVGQALKAAGLDLARVNLSDPRVDALLSAGATPEQFAGLASEALKGKKANPMAWVLSVMPDRLAQASQVKATKHAGFASKDYRNGVEADGTFTA